MKFIDVIEKYRKCSFSERDKGARFEELMLKFLQTYQTYKGTFCKVWLWNEFPFRKDFGGQDIGIDLVAKTYEGEYWAIQCKCYEESKYIDKSTVDSFLSTSSKSFQDENLNRVNFSYRLWISTTNNWSNKASEVLKNQNIPCKTLSLSKLESAEVDWDKLENGVCGEKAELQKKTPKNHQLEAINAVQEHFKTYERGKLIMACGTGKTFTSLKIAETLAKDKEDYTHTHTIRIPLGAYF